MGVYFSHGTAHWSYRYFSEFRNKLAKEINIDLVQMEGYSDAEEAIDWATIKDPIVFLLDHPDDSGDLPPEECKLIAPRLRELVQNWDPNDLDRQQALLLAEGMEQAAEEDELFVFC